MAFPTPTTNKFRNHNEMLRELQSCDTLPLTVRKQVAGMQWENGINEREVVRLYNLYMIPAVQETNAVYDKSIKNKLVRERTRIVYARRTNHD